MRFLKLTLSFLILIEIANCDTKIDRIQPSEYTWIMLIQHGLDYPRSWERKQENCNCNAVELDEQCRLFCNALNSINRIVSLPKRKMLTNILKDLSSFADDMALQGKDDVITQFYGASILLYFFKSPTDDNIIRQYILNDLNICIILFSPSTRIEANAWIFNRPDKSKWAMLIDSLNCNSNKLKVRLRSYLEKHSKGIEYESPDKLINPFKNFYLPDSIYKRDSIRWVTPLKALEYEMIKNSEN